LTARFSDIAVLDAIPSCDELGTYSWLRQAIRVFFSQAGMYFA